MLPPLLGNSTGLCSLPDWATGIYLLKGTPVLCPSPVSLKQRNVSAILSWKQHNQKALLCKSRSSHFPVNLQCYYVFLEESGKTFQSWAFSMPESPFCLCTGPRLFSSQDAALFYLSDKPEPSLTNHKIPASRIQQHRVKAGAKTPWYF